MFPSIRANTGVYAHPSTCYDRCLAIGEKGRDAVDGKGRSGLPALRGCSPEDSIGDGGNRNTHVMRRPRASLLSLLVWRRPGARVSIATAGGCAKVRAAELVISSHISFAGALSIGLPGSPVTSEGCWLDIGDRSGTPSGSLSPGQGSASQDFVDVLLGYTTLTFLDMLNRRF